MRQHQDDLKAIQERHKDDRNAQAQAQMAFYKEKGINPLGGCLPLLIQLPILIILYSVFRAGLGSTLPSGIIYSFVPHIKSLNSNFFGINLSRPDKFLILPAIAAILQYFQAKDMQVKQFGDLSKVKSDDPTVIMNKQMVYLMPVMIFVVAYRLPAGLSLYYIVTTLVAWLQQIYVAKTFVPNNKTTVTVRSKKLTN
jgi:YidC/Oxa1 family membrane protein insertase